MEREWAGMRGVRRTNLESRGEERVVSMPLLRPIFAKRLPCMSQRSVGTLEHTASKYVHLALTFFLGVTGFEGIRPFF